MQSDEDEEEPQLGPDGDLVSAIISTAVIPRVCNLIEGGALDPFSSKDIRHLVNLAEEVEVSVGKDHHKFQVIDTFHKPYQLLTRSVQDIFEGCF
jgi:GC-rich sequence DNA-binding factor